jgi:hypothetical protein
MAERRENSSPDTRRSSDPAGAGGLPDYLRRVSGDFSQVVLWALDYETLYHDNLRVLAERFLNQVRPFCATVDLFWGF